VDVKSAGLCTRSALLLDLLTSLEELVNAGAIDSERAVPLGCEFVAS